MYGRSELKTLFKKSISYTLLTTICSALVALGLLYCLKGFFYQNLETTAFESVKFKNFNFLDEVIPEHAFHPFITGNVISSLILAIMMGVAFTKVSDKDNIERFSSSILEGLMKLASFLMKGMPFVVFSSVALTLKSGESIQEIKSLSFFLTVVILANLIQGIAILPCLLKLKKIPVIKTLIGFKDALIYAFFSKSSIATLPIAKNCAENNLGISPKISQFTFPIFTTINMNGCAAFIITALFLGFYQTYQTISLMQVLMVLFLSTVAAIGNAGVPMGCYFLSTALLSALGLDLKLIGLILPVYGMIDMVETALNVWSDSVITTVIDKEIKEQKEIELAL